MIVPDYNKRLPRLLAVAIAAMIFMGSSPRVQAATSPTIQEPLVGTAAGSGLVGAADGPTRSASFLEPTGVAIGPDGSIYVADASAQNIRRIYHGHVSTVAGFGPAGTTAQSRLGGFANGPAASARFNRPVAIAVAKDGSLLVADELNHCIRKISRGFVSTFAGSQQSGSSDGLGSVARFALPKALAFDGSGDLYVADFGNGIRKITPSGNVTTIHAFAGANESAISGIAIRGSGQSMMLAYITLGDPSAGQTDSASDHIYVLQGGAVRAIISSGDQAVPWRQDLRIGRAFAISIMDENSLVVTDLLGNAVRYMRLADQPFNMGVLSRSLVGASQEVEIKAAGNRVADSTQTSFDAPMGIVASRSGTIIVADSGSRTIREISGLNIRGPLASNLSNLRFRNNSYRVVIIGDSYLWTGVLWPESISGGIETGLNAGGRALGLSRPVNVLAASIDGLPLSAETSFVDTNFGDGEADLVILLTDNFNLSNESKSSAGLRGGGAADYQKAFPEAIRSLAGRLRKNGTQLEIVAMPCCGWTAPSENARARELSQDPNNYDYDQRYQLALQFQNALSSTGLHTLKLLGPMEKAEELANRSPLFNSNDHHLTVQGAVLVGQLILGDLEQWRPWGAHDP